MTPPRDCYVRVSIRSATPRKCLFYNRPRMLLPTPPGLRYGFGWENQLLETAFLAAFAVPLLSLRPFPPGCPPPAVLPWLYKWLAFRIMFGTCREINGRRPKSFVDYVAFGRFGWGRMAVDWRF